LDVLHEISDAYYHIRALITLERHYFEPTYIMGMQGDTTRGVLFKNIVGSVMTN